MVIVLVPKQCRIKPSSPVVPYRYAKIWYYSITTRTTTTGQVAQCGKSRDNIIFLQQPNYFPHRRKCSKDHSLLFVGGIIFIWKSQFSVSWCPLSIFAIWFHSGFRRRCFPTNIPSNKNKLHLNELQGSSQFTRTEGAVSCKLFDPIDKYECSPTG